MLQATSKIKLFSFLGAVLVFAFAFSFLFVADTARASTSAIASQATSASAANVTEAAQKLKSELVAPVKDLFSHRKHHNSFQGNSITCTDCHSFSVKSSSFDPLSPNVAEGFLKISQKVCHECHLGKVSQARINQCSLCHKNPSQLAPESHALAWRSRHGKFAQQNSESCFSCHKDSQNSCSNCHTQRNSMTPVVHRPNFRLSHSIEARMNPGKCTTCHGSASYCLQCHKGGR